MKKKQIQFNFFAHNSFELNTCSSKKVSNIVFKTKQDIDKRTVEIKTTEDNCSKCSTLLSSSSRPSRLITFSSSLLGLKNLSRTPSSPWTRPPISTKLIAWPKMSTVRFTEADLGTNDFVDQIRLLSMDPPVLSISENTDFSMLRENFLLSKSNSF